MKDEHRQVLLQACGRNDRMVIPDHELLGEALTELQNRGRDIATLKRHLLEVGEYYENEMTSLAARFHESHGIEN